MILCCCTNYPELLTTTWMRELPLKKTRQDMVFNSIYR